MSMIRRCALPAAFALLTTPSFAQDTTALAQDYGETRRGVGLARQGAIMEVFASEDTGSWTITITLPDGVTCLVASGQFYESVSEAMPPNV